MTSWINRLSKAEVTAELEKLGIDPSGTLDALRARLRDFVIANPEYEYPAGEDDRKITMDDERRSIDSTTPDPAKVMDQIRKWGCHFDGKDPLAFLERVEELRQGYGYSGDQLLLGLPELLRGDTLLWYRNSRAVWDSWDDFQRDFRNQFLPRRYRAQLSREIQGRFQKPEEPFHKYATALLTSMRRAGGYSADDQLERLYDNMSPGYKYYIRLDDITSLGDLHARAAEYEAIEEQNRERNAERKAPTATPVVASTTYNREECCWRCKQRGHTRLDCKRPAKKFCSRCGKDGVLTRDCHPTPGNAARAGGEAAASRTPTPSE
ncbi:uncharacterized protein LOC112459414 [Temnothorax curvispinosus]|uniref:Uncharacterized protein LOC112459414 n=1 Tax=Temnothorax curvispinosus TaxID=300111 RepID=A0A6J1QAI2_9HYME|nr:uncharacterized protein LOC112459414 [Temnothorax curvispinosus]